MIRILVGDVRERLRDLADASVQCVVTSPPYFGLRDYGVEGQIGLEPTLAEYVETLVLVFREVRRVLRNDGTLWCNLGDGYASGGRSVYDRNPTNLGNIASRQLTRPNDQRFKAKNLMMVPARVAIALQDDGWYLRSDIIWAKPNPMPESCRDRPTSVHEHIFLLTKSAKYFYDQDAVREPLADSSVQRLSQPTFGQQTGGAKDYAVTGQNASRSARKSINNLHEKFVRQEKWATRYEGWEECDKSIGANQRNVWTIPTHPFPLAHFATFAPEIPRRCIKVGTSEKGQCSACGAPWRRVRDRVADGFRVERDVGCPLGPPQLTAGSKYVPVQYEWLGWQPSCQCNAGEPVPQTILDPFAGAGTTGLVADQLGRDAILIELSPEYVAMAENRIRGDAPMFCNVSVSNGQ